MQRLNLTQGTPEWSAHRARARNASEASAVLGCSPYMTRTELLHAMHTGLRPEPTREQERIFAEGHAIEAAQRPGAALLVGEALYPVVGVAEIEGIELSASFDGLTMAEDIPYECKTLNDALRAALPYAGDGSECPNDSHSLPKHYRVQMEQQLMVCGGERTLFVAATFGGSDVRRCWYYPDPALRAEIIAGWKQFAEDLAAYTPVDVIAKPAAVGHSPDQLPALRSSVKGELVLESNIKEWEAAALAYIKAVRDHELKTDEDFANADAAAKWCDTSKTTLQGVKSSLMSATGDVNTAVGTLDRIMKELDQTRITFTNAIKARKESRKGEIVAASIKALREHVDGLNARLGKPYMPQSASAADFGGAIRGKSSFAKMQEALDATLANAKVAANAMADLIQSNREQLRPQNGVAGEDWINLFPDFAQVCTKQAEDFHNLVAARVGAEERRHQAAADEARRKEAQPALLERAREIVADIETAEVLRDAIASAPTANVVPMPTKAPATAPTLKLGQINALIAPLSIDAAGLAALGFPPAATDKNAKLYHSADFPRMRAAMVSHLQAVQLQEAA